VEAAKEEEEPVEAAKEEAEPVEAVEKEEEPVKAVAKEEEPREEEEAVAKEAVRDGTRIGMKRKVIKDVEYWVSGGEVFDTDMVLRATVSRTPEGKSKLAWL
jgi:hypothetical protein